MRSNSDSVKRVKSEIDAVGKEINYRIERLEKLPKEMDDNCEALRTFIEDRQEELNKQFRKAYMVRGEDVWDFTWDSIWDMVKDFQHQAAMKQCYSYPNLESELKRRRTSLGRQLKLNAMWADQVWTEVWNAVWKVIHEANNEYLREAKAEFERCAEELDPLLDKKVALKKELEELHNSEEGVYRMLRNTFSHKGKGKH
ncbi:MAG TPA: hypothetical protein P5309_08755 [Syntrophomonadaceae bacterium]|nr:hypothetical protein [Syntrophomonadaceae bacterium]